VKLPAAPDLALLLVRTDYRDEQAWTNAWAAATAVHDKDDFERMGASLYPVQDADLADITPQALASLDRDGYLSAIAVADAQTMTDLTIQFVNLNEFQEPIGRTFRAVPAEVEPIVANLSLANMDFSDFADNVDADGIFRGF
jgi:hypothetical protein